ncbi:MAG: hypothetical protein INQ03_08890 [Candidatus Heimdallarchaeota archaeon]|nr:hypothetical protein [Candidatus Heimdallarchaeota archaeon]
MDFDRARNIIDLEIKMLGINIDYSLEREEGKIILNINRIHEIYPTSIADVKVNTLKLSGRITKIPENFAHPDFLNELYVDLINLETLPDLSRYSNLKQIHINKSKITALPRLHESIEFISAHNCRIERIENEMLSLPNLRYICIHGNPDIIISAHKCVEFLAKGAIIGIPDLYEEIDTILSNLEYSDDNRIPYEKNIPARELQVLNLFHSIVETEKHDKGRYSLEDLSDNWDYAKNVYAYAIRGGHVRRIICRSNFNLSSLNQLKKLELLDLRSMKAQFLSELHEVEKLYWSGPIDISLSHMKKMRDLSLEGLISQDTMNSIPDLTNLKKLVLREYTPKNTRYDMKLPEDIGRLVNLRTLILSRMRLDGLPESVKYLKRLEILDIRVPGIKEIPAGLGDLPNLKRLLTYKVTIPNKVYNRLLKNRNKELLHISSSLWTYSRNYYWDIQCEKCNTPTKVAICTQEVKFKQNELKDLPRRAFVTDKLLSLLEEEGISSIDELKKIDLNLLKKIGFSLNEIERVNKVLKVMLQENQKSPLSIAILNLYSGYQIDEYLKDELEIKGYYENKKGFCCLECKEIISKDKISYDFIGKDGDWYKKHRYNGEFQDDDEYWEWNNHNFIGLDIFQDLVIL